MFESISVFYNDFLLLSKDNPFIAGILGLYVAGLTTWFLKDVPTKLSQFIKNELFTSLVISERGESYGHMFDEKIQFINFTTWVTKHSDNNFSRVFGINRQNEIWSIVPGLGLNFFVFKKRLFWYRKIEVQGSGQSNSGTKLAVTITTYGRNKKIFSAIFDEFKSLHTLSDEDESKYIRKIDGNGWEEIQEVPEKDLNLVFMNDSVKNEIIETFEIFHEQLERCKKVQTPHRISILLEGPTGTGKTTIIKALANLLNKHVYMMDPSDLLQSNLPRHFANWGHSGIIVIEDIDSLSSIKSRGKHINKDLAPALETPNSRIKRLSANDKKSQLEEVEAPSPAKNSFDFDYNEIFGGISKVLNNLDGLVEYNGSIIIMTTNSVGLIDDAMLRPGRIDKIIHVGWLTKETIIKTIIKLFELTDDEETYNKLNSALTKESISGAELSNIYKFTTNLDEFISKINQEKD